MARIGTLLVMLALLSTAPPVHAATCDRENFAAVAEQMTADLRALNGRRQGELRERLADLAKRRGWPEGEAEERLVALLANGELKALDARAGQLLVRIDELGDRGAESGSCRDLDELKRAARELVETTSVKLDRIASRLDELLDRPPRVATRPRVSPAPLSPATPPTPRSPARVTVPSPAWQTTVEAPAEVTAALRQLPPAIAAPDATFSAEEVQAAGRGLFGTLSAELASVIQFAFRSYGRPNGYILGQEGGAAFLAGLRYGNGTLVTKTKGQRRVYWQGPSVGFDFGVAGSRTMILVYNLDRPEQLEKRFAGADGAAFLVGGVGITFLKRGRVVLAPIRTGLGVRLGASVGYMSFSPKPTLNPL
ncbi:MAG: EipA family protein [Hyphomicrobiaceae bacterium]